MADREDKVLARDYTGKSPERYCAEIYVYGQDRGDRLALAPLTPWAAIDLGLELVARGFKALRTPRALR